MYCISPVMADTTIDFTPNIFDTSIEVCAAETYRPETKIARLFVDTSSLTCSLPHEKSYRDLNKRFVTIYSTNELNEYEQKFHSYLKEFKMHFFFSTLYEKAVKSQKSAANFLMDEVERSIKNKKMSHIDMILKQISFEKAGDISAISVINSTKRCRNSLKYWELAKYNAEQKLRRSGYKPEKIFAGV